MLVFSFERFGAMRFVQNGFTHIVQYIDGLVRLRTVYNGLEKQVYYDLELCDIR